MQIKKNLFAILINIFYSFRMWVSRNLRVGFSILLNDTIKPIEPINELAIFTGLQKGKYLLIVNLASKCGFTPQYAELETLNQQQKKNLIILGFPSNDFRGQEPASDEEISNFCRVNYGVTFKIFPKNHVIGANKQEVYAWLTNPDKNGWNLQEPSWNFHKYLIDPVGKLVGVFSPAVSPLSKDILNLIKNEH